MLNPSLYTSPLSRTRVLVNDFCFMHVFYDCMYYTHYLTFFFSILSRLFQVTFGFPQRNGHPSYARLIIPFSDFTLSTTTTSDPITPSFSSSHSIWIAFFIYFLFSSLSFPVTESTKGIFYSPVDFSVLPLAIPNFIYPTSLKRSRILFLLFQKGSFCAKKMLRCPSEDAQNVVKCL